MTHILAMGGYGQFVWPAYAISAVALIAAVVFTLRAYVSARRQLRRIQSDTQQSPT